MKSVYKLPVLNDSLGYTKYTLKDSVFLRDVGKFLNEKFEDRRRVSQIVQHTNRHGDTFLFAFYGGKKNQTVVTLGRIVGGRWILT